jgi:hypothetical protein
VAANLSAVGRGAFVTRVGVSDDSLVTVEVEDMKNADWCFRFALTVAEAERFRDRIAENIARAIEKALPCP